MSSPVDILADLAARLREIRNGRNLSQIEAAKILGVSARTLQAWEAGEAFPQPRHRRQLADFLRDEEAA